MLIDKLKIGFIIFIIISSIIYIYEISSSKILYVNSVKVDNLPFETNEEKYMVALGSREGSKTSISGTSNTDFYQIIDEYSKMLNDKEQEQYQKELEEYNRRLEELKSNLEQRVTDNETPRYESSDNIDYSDDYSISSDNQGILKQAYSKGINVGTHSGELDKFTQYDDMIKFIINKHQSECDYPITLNLIKSIILAESSGNPNADNGYAKGLMQLEYTVSKSFINYGKAQYNEYWTSDDRINPYKNVDYGVWVFAGNLQHYKGDYLKAIQSYNYSFYSLDKLIKYYGNNWFENRIHMAELNGKSKYGNPTYVESVLKYFK